MNRSLLTDPQPPRLAVARRTWLLALAGALLLLATQSVVRLQVGRRLAREAVPHQQGGVPGGRRLLVLGDSTAVGTGASDPWHSLVGRLGREHPSWHIDNQARNGARIADLPQQLAQATGPLDLVLVMAGGNDVIRGSDMADVEGWLRRLLVDLRARGARVVLMPCGDLSHAQLLAPVSGWMHRRSTALHAAVARAAGGGLATVVDLRLPREQDPFVQDPRRMHAADGLHPSDDGYAQWYRTLAPVMARA
jgi:lysophospholipase L1-like esterase